MIERNKYDYDVSFQLLLCFRRIVRSGSRFQNGQLAAYYVEVDSEGESDLAETDFLVTLAVKVEEENKKTATLMYVQLLFYEQGCKIFLKVED